MRPRDRDLLIRQGARSALPIYRRLALAIERAQRWQDDGYPNGTGGGGVRGGDTDGLPLRKVLAGPDAIANKILDIYRTLVMWAELGAELEAFIVWTETVERHEDDRPTAACMDCGRTVLDAYDWINQRLDKLKAGRCTYHIEERKGVPYEPEVGCHGRWQRERVAAWRARRGHVAGVAAARAMVSSESSEVRP